MLLIVLVFVENSIFFKSVAYAGYTIYNYVIIFSDNILKYNYDKINYIVATIAYQELT